MRYIDADKELYNLSDDLPYKASVRRVLMQAPEADVVEVRHGKWIAVPSSDMSTGKAYKCSECGKFRFGVRLPPYCQECGARMDGDEDG